MHEADNGIDGIIVNHILMYTLNANYLGFCFCAGSVIKDVRKNMFDIVVLDTLHRLTCDIR